MIQEKTICFETANFAKNCTQLKEKIFKQISISSSSTKKLQFGWVTTFRVHGTKKSLLKMSEVILLWPESDSYNRKEHWWWFGSVDQNPQTRLFSRKCHFVWTLQRVDRTWNTWFLYRGTSRE